MCSSDLVPLFLTAEDGEEGPMGPPGTGSGGGGVGTYFDPVTWNGSTDRVLGVGQHTSDSFTAATSIPLHIACGDGQEYEIELNGTFTASAFGADCALNVNNATLAGNFRQDYIQWIGATLSSISTTAALAGFPLQYGSSIYQAKYTICTSTSTKSISGQSKGQSTTYGVINYIQAIESLDTTTVWSSLGTIAMPNAWTGSVVVKRIA